MPDVEAGFQGPQFAATAVRVARGVPTVLVPAEICARIKRAREGAGLTQEQLGELLNVTKRTIGYYEKETVPWSHMDVISAATGRSLRWLLHGQDWLATDEWEEIHRIEAKIDDVLMRLPDPELDRLEAEAEEEERAARSERTDAESEQGTPGQQETGP